MIEINLLPLRELHWRKRRFRTLLVAGLAMALMATLLGYHHMIRSKHVSHLEDELRVNQRDRDGLSRTATQADEIRKEILKRQGKLQALDRLSRGRTLLSGLLGSLPETMPAELWLTSLTASHEDFNLEGMAPDHRLIADFLGNLSKVPNLHHLDLIEVSSKEIDGTGYSRFKLQGRLTRGPSSDGGDAGVP